MSSTNEIVAKFNPILFIIDTPICILTEKIIKALLVYIVNLFFFKPTIPVACPLISDVWITFAFLNHPFVMAHMTAQTSLMKSIVSFYPFLSFLLDQCPD